MQSERRDSMATTTSPDGRTCLLVILPIRVQEGNKTIECGEEIEMEGQDWMAIRLMMRKPLEVIARDASEHMKRNTGLELRLKRATVQFFDGKSHSLRIKLTGFTRFDFSAVARVIGSFGRKTLFATVEFVYAATHSYPWGYALHELKRRADESLMTPKQEGAVAFSPVQQMIKQERLSPKRQKTTHVPRGTSLDVYWPTMQQWYKCTVEKHVTDAKTLEIQFENENATMEERKWLYCVEWEDKDPRHYVVLDPAKQGIDWKYS